MTPYDRAVLKTVSYILLDIQVGRIVLGEHTWCPVRLDLALIEEPVIWEDHATD